MIELSLLEILEMVVGFTLGTMVIAMPAVIWFALHSLDKWVQARRSLDLEI